MKFYRSLKIPLMAINDLLQHEGLAATSAGSSPLYCAPVAAGGAARKLSEMAAGLQLQQGSSPAATQASGAVAAQPLRTPHRLLQVARSSFQIRHAHRSRARTGARASRAGSTGGTIAWARLDSATGIGTSLAARTIIPRRT